MMAQSMAEQPRRGLVWPWLCAALAVLMAGLLIGPRVPYERQAEFCVVNVRIAGPFGVSIICDSPEYLRLAREPSALLEPTNLRQSRPGLVLLAAALAWPLSPLANLAQRLGIHASRPDIDQSRIDGALAQDFSGYAVYIGLNAAIVLLSFHVFRLISAARAADAPSTTIFVSVCFLLAACDPLKPFMWSPHNQMFNILVPVFAVWASLRASEGRMRDWRFAVVAGLITGFGATAYPYFIIVLPCVLVACAVSEYQSRPRSAVQTVSVNMLLLFALALLPETLWYLFVRFKTGGFYQYEMENDRAVVWMFDAWQRGPLYLVSAWWEKFWQLLNETTTQLIPVIALVFILALARGLGRNAPHPPLRGLAPLLLSCAMVSMLTAAFYTTTGTIAWRLAFAVVPPLVVGAGAMVIAAADSLPVRRRWIVACACAALAIAQSVWTVVKDGPYS